MTAVRPLQPFQALPRETPVAVIAVICHAGLGTTYRHKRLARNLDECTKHRRRILPARVVPRQRCQGRRLIFQDTHQATGSVVVTHVCLHDVVEPDPAPRGDSERALLFDRIAIVNHRVGACDRRRPPCRQPDTPKPDASQALELVVVGESKVSSGYTSGRVQRASSQALSAVDSFGNECEQCPRKRWCVGRQ